MAIIIMVHVEISLSRFHFKEGVAREEADQKFLECHRVVVDNQALPPPREEGCLFDYRERLVS